MSTAAAVIIGDELLTGKFADENGPYLIRRLRALGVDLRRLAVVSDDLDEIADEVRRASDAFDHVFTSGGVGPTHDDVTLEGVARAFGVPLERRPELVAVIERFDLPMNDATLRMATLPAGCTLVDHAGLSYPVILCRNVWILPGVPKLFRNKFEAIAERFAGQQVRTARLYTDEPETHIAARLQAVVDAHPAVEIGSYPRFGEGPYKVIVTLESRDAGALASAEAALRAALTLVELP